MPEEIDQDTKRDGLVKQSGNLRLHPPFSGTEIPELGDQLLSERVERVVRVLVFKQFRSGATEEFELGKFVKQPHPFQADE
jgi:hypothetical protein